MLNEITKSKLDKRLADLLNSIQNEDKQTDIAIAVWQILKDHTREDIEEPDQYTVLPPDWEECWRDYGTIPSTYSFSNLADDRDCRLRFSVFEGLARFVLANDGPHLHRKNSQALREALEDYLHCRGCLPVSGDNGATELRATDETDAGRKKKTKANRGGRKPIDPKGDAKIAEEWRTGKYRTHAELEDEKNYAVGRVHAALDRHRKREA